MSTVVHHGYAGFAETDGPAWLQFPFLKRLVIAVAGCAVMILSGAGLANYLDISTATGSDISLLGVNQADAATVN